jgi:hypothetical protein
MTSNTYVNEESLQQFTFLANKIHHGFTIIEKNDSLPLQFYLKKQERGRSWIKFFTLLYDFRSMWSVDLCNLRFLQRKKHCNCH